MANEKKEINIYQKLSKARVKLNESKMKKSGYNDFNKFSYYELHDFLPKINSIFDEVGLIGIFNLDEKRARLKIVNTENIEEELIFYSPVAVADIKGAQAIQKLGGAHTYLKRYLYLNALEISENDAIDPLDQKKNADSDYKQNDKQKKQQTKPIESNENFKLKTFIAKNNLDITKIATKFKLNQESNEIDYSKALANLQTLNEESLQTYAKEG